MLHRQTFVLAELFRSFRSCGTTSPHSYYQQFFYLRCGKLRYTNGTFETNSPIKWAMMKINFHFISDWMEYDWKENCYHNHISFNIKLNGNQFSETMIKVTAWILVKFFIFFFSVNMQRKMFYFKRKVYINIWF